MPPKLVASTSKFDAFRNRSAAQVAHAGAETADELVDHGFERSAMRYTAFDALGYELGQAVAPIRGFAGG